MTSSIEQPASLLSEAGAHFLVPARVNLADRVATILRRYIVVEQLPAGSRMPPERQLADTMNVSRTVLREAISRLIGEGLLERASPRTLIVGDFDRTRVAAALSPIDEEESEFRDLMEVRIIMEIGAIDAIVARATSQDLQRIERWLLDGEHRLARGEQIHTADANFHAALLRALNNRAVDAFLPMLQDQMRSHVMFTPHQITGPQQDQNERVMREHRAIFEAIRDGNADLARSVMQAHLSHYVTNRK
jgi:GntR family transcriptional repressor for pyruvate dehydrogenase complex